jgi:FlaA1/EpsC-like NDP-sugar epimerase
MPTDFRRNVLMTMARVGDLTVVCVVFLATLAISSGSYSWPGLAEVLIIRIKVGNFLLFMAYIVLCSGIFSACGFYRSHRLSRWHQRLAEIVFAVTIITGVLLVLGWTLPLVFATNEFLLVFWLSSFCALVLSRETARRLMHLARSHGRNLRNIVIVGEGPAAYVLADRVRLEASLGYRILRIIDARELSANDRIASDI